MFIKFFFIFFFIFGVLFIIISPPFQSPDEKNHFFRAIHLSQGNLLGEKNNNRLGGNLPTIADSLAKSFEYIIGNYASKTTFSAIFNCLSWKSDTKNFTFKDFNNTGFYAPIGYLHSAITIKIAQYLGFPPIIWLWFSKIISLIVWLLLIYFAVSYLKELKILFLCLAFLPASLAVNISLSPDMLCNGLSFWCTCATFYYINDKKQIVNNTFKIYFALAICIITWMKIVYFPLVFLLLMIPSFYISNKKYFWSLFATNIFIILFWAYISSSLSIKYEDYDINYRNILTTNQGIDHGKQLFFILLHPFEFFLIISKTIIEYTPSTLAHYVGKFGYEKNYLSFPILAILWAMIFMQMLKKCHINLKNRFFYLVISLIIVFCFSITMYMLWTPVGESTIWNFGGRYFIPIFPLIFIAISGIFSLPQKYNFWVDCTSIFCLFVSNISLILAILNRYFV